MLGENTPLALALSKALGSAIVSESDTRSDCIKSSFINNKCNLYIYEYRVSESFTILVVMINLPHLRNEEDLRKMGKKLLVGGVEAQCCSGQGLTVHH